MKTRTRAETSEPMMTPMMNLMVVLIPMLLVSTEFARFSILDTQLSKRGTNPDSQQTRISHDTTDLTLTVLLSDTAVTLGAAGGQLPSLRYREFHHFGLRGTNKGVISEYDQKSGTYKSPAPPPRSEKQEISLYLVCPIADTVIWGYYTTSGYLATNQDGFPIAHIQQEEKVYLEGDYENAIVDRKDALRRAPVRLEKVISSCAAAVRNRHAGARDRDQIILASERGVKYDKLVAFMDELREKKFSIWLSRPRT